MKYVPPSVKETAFNCPHCGALAQQHWYQLLATQEGEANTPPKLINNGRGKKMDALSNDTALSELRNHLDEMSTGRPSFKAGIHAKIQAKSLINVNAASCYNCNEPSIWVYDRLVYPQQSVAPPANDDLPPSIRGDYDEASSILDLSPRGSAALLRLAIQKLCKEFGKPGTNINNDIAALVKDGLSTRIQMALDAVRVIGNNAVHPGRIDLRDDRATAESLFKLVNLIVEKMISEPKHVDEVYAGLPEGALKAIERRDDNR